MSDLQLLWVVVLIASVIALAWPYLFCPAILRLLPAKPLAKTGPPPASASLLFCAFNEADAMPAKIANLRALKARNPALQILAYDDGSNDQTATLLGAASDVVNLVEGTGRRGKAHGMKQLAALAAGEVLVFTDANVVFGEDAIDRLLDAYRDPRIGGALGCLRYVHNDGGSTAITGSLYWRIEEYLKSLESRTGSVMGADGSIFSVRRALYPDFPDDVLDDLTVSMAVVFAGRRLVRVADALAFEDATTNRGDERRRKHRIAARSWRTHRYLRPMLARMSILDRFKYASRKMVRWFGAVFIVSGTIAAIALAWSIEPWLATGGLVVAGSAIAIGFRSRRGPAAALADVLSGYFATLAGLWQSMRGRNYTTWTPPVSRL